MLNIDNLLLPLRKPLYLKDVAFLKYYADGKYKLTRCACVRNKGVISPDEQYKKKGTVNAEKSSSNISRARNTVREYVLCNPFEFFCTFTIDKTKYDRYDLEAYHKAVSQWIRDYNKKHGTYIKYILIPEQHQDGAWHEHGFLMGLPLELLQTFTLDMHLLEYILSKLRRGEMVYNWPDYAAKFGFVDLEPIRDKDRAASYVTKYITKDLERSVTEMGAHLYYASKGLQKATLVKSGKPTTNIPADYESDYCKVNWFDAAGQDISPLLQLIED